MFTMTAREFNQSVARAQRIADSEPVLVTRHGAPTYVLLSIGEYERLMPTAPKKSLRDLLGLSDDDIARDDGEFDRILADIRANTPDRPPVEF